MIWTPLRDVGRYDLLPGFRGASGRSGNSGSGVIRRTIKSTLSCCCAKRFQCCISALASATFGYIAGFQG